MSTSQPERLRPRTGSSLLELLLALGLTVVVVSLIATAIQINGVTLTRVQASIERKQTARGILGMIQNDLRAGIQYKANEYAPLQELFQSIRLANGQSALADALTEGDGEVIAENDSTAADTDFEDEEPQEPDTDGEPVFVGERNFVSIDISRLPRIDQYHPSIRTSEESRSTLADVKTVAYFVSQGNGQSRTALAGINQASGGQPAVTGGLFRRQIDRSVASFEGLEVSSEPDEYSELVATEVVELTFRYFDGSNWATSWDSEERGGFPLAVEVYVLIDPARASPGGSAQSGATDREALETYRAVVHIPAAEIIEEESDDE